ncbi:MAG: hypothetical protein J6C89_00460 [Clostridia bacterium]|nr:hypothetical protein [Clostridia bacterium]
MKKILSIIISHLLVVLALASCADGMHESTTTADLLGPGSCILYPPTTSPIKTLDDGTVIHSHYENVNFGGRTFTFESEFYDGDWQIYEVCGVDETKQDTLSRAIQIRNETIEGLYNCKIEHVKKTNRELTDHFMIYPDICVFSYNAYSKGNGDFYNINDLVNLSNPWWDESYVSEMIVDGYLYSVAGAASLSAYDATRVLYFNKDILLGTPSLASTDLYSLVENNEWTMDKFTEILRNVPIGEANGFCGSEDALRSLYFGAGGNYLFKYDDAAGNTTFKHAFTDTSANAFNSVRAIFAADSAVIDENVSAFEEFKSGNTLFASGTLGDMEHISGVNFGVLPYPAYSKEQISRVGYRSIVDGGFYYYCIPKTINYDLSLICQFMELYAFHSYYISFAEYLNMHKYLFIDNENDRNMMDVILQSRTYDLAYYHGFADVDEYVTDALIGATDVTLSWVQDKGTALENAANAYNDYLNKNT